MDKSAFLTDPIEERNNIDLDMKFRVNENHVGRAIKHLADLNLQTDLLYNALTYYQIAITTLYSCDDWLWIGGIF